MLPSCDYSEEEILLQIEDIHKDYNGHSVLKNINIAVRDIHVTGQIKGQVVGFIGPSGIGKTTLLRIIAGLDPPTKGTVKLEGEAISVKAGDVGVVAQSYPLFNHHTVYGNLLLAAKKGSKLDKKQLHDRIIAYLNEFDLYTEMNHYPIQLSGGQRQRCAILQQVLARNTVNASDHMVLIMDEPFSGLDPLAKKKTENLIRKVADMEEKNTIIVVTHDIGAAVIVSDHIWVLGRDYGEGKPIPGAYIVKNYNLIDLGLAWNEDVEKKPEFTEFVHELTELFKTL